MKPLVLLTYALIGVASAASSCTDDADQEAWKSHGRANFRSDMQECGLNCLGAARCTASCIKKKESYTDQCSACFGDLADCTQKSCLSQCAFGESPACSKCLAQHCAPAFTACSGLTPASGMSVQSYLSAACTDDADQKVWKAHGEANFRSDMQECGLNCLGAALCTASCMKKKESYTDQCSACFGDLAGCTQKYCLSQCAFGESPACKTCLAQHCNAAFTSCSGLALPNASAIEDALLV
eukprot:TRINITY_DN4039_c0_g1_i1.p1 TRINITY_DN4039_c0_g1~~TRINITY_DN4039_c0_g1_i1.p1  ORF type:complete len:257 (+),score=22.49 TRINITY_DN4039_c0_g1_i1:53-772(+)